MKNPKSPLISIVVTFDGQTDKVCDIKAFNRKAVVRQQKHRKVAHVSLNDREVITTGGHDFVIVPIKRINDGIGDLIINWAKQRNK